MGRARRPGAIWVFDQEGSYDSDASRFDLNWVFNTEGSYALDGFYDSI